MGGFRDEGLDAQIRVLEEEAHSRHLNGQLTDELILRTQRLRQEADFIEAKRSVQAADHARWQRDNTPSMEDAYNLTGVYSAPTSSSAGAMDGLKVAAAAAVVVGIGAAAVAAFQGLKKAAEKDSAAGKQAP